MIGHYGSVEHVCWSSTEARGQRVSWKRTKTASHVPHTRRHQSPTTCEKPLKQIKSQQHLKRTDFGGPRQCMGQTGNAFAIERSMQVKPGQHAVLRSAEESLRTRSIVRFAMRVPSYSAANRSDEYKVKTNNNRWPRIMSAGEELKACNQLGAALQLKIKRKIIHFIYSRPVSVTSCSLDVPFPFHSCAQSRQNSHIRYIALILKDVLSFNVFTLAAVASDRPRHVNTVLITQLYHAL